ncbi:MAG: hypothetical protein JWM75_84 [Sphingomonas bacterium]|nr:hypothetical protein [Sphingomonas bacterium]
MRPRQILYFERAYLLSLAIAVVSLFLYWDALQAVASPILLVGASVVLMGVMVTLVLLTSRRRSAVAKWLLVVLTTIGIVMALPSVGGSLSAGIGGWLSIGQTLLQLAAMILLFTRAARAWLRAPADGF